MNRLMKWTRAGLRLASLGLFQVLALFWIIKLYYCVRGYLTSGVRGVQGALVHGTPFPDDPKEWAHSRSWELVVLRLLVIALITVLLGVIHRRTLAKFWRELVHGPSKKPQPKISKL